MATIPPEISYTYLLTAAELLVVLVILFYFILTRVCLIFHKHYYICRSRVCYTLLAHRRLWLKICHVGGLVRSKRVVCCWMWMMWLWQMTRVLRRHWSSVLFHQRHRSLQLLYRRQLLTDDACRRHHHHDQQQQQQQSSGSSDVLVLLVVSCYVMLASCVDVRKPCWSVVNWVMWNWQCSMTERRLWWNLKTMMTFLMSCFTYF